MQNYVVAKKLGTGTYGSAYVVTLRSNPSQQYVLKKVRVEGGDASADSEVKVLRSLSHPLVLSYVDHFIYKSHLCIITEYCDAGDLDQLLRARKTALPEPQLLDIFAQVLLAIQHVHSKNILHRDLKTQNIFLTSGGSVRLGDFGISRPLNGTKDLASTIIGTPYYMSPEVMSSMPYDFKSDMWSMGCVLYEMMSLKHAFDAADMSSLVIKILRGEHLPIPQGYSQELKDLVRQLLSKNPIMRPSPEQILKMPFMKEYAARARETVALLEQQRGAGGRAIPRPNGRATEHGQAPAGPPSFHRHSYSTGIDSNTAVTAAGGLSPNQLDKELEAAKDRLRRIQLEREALAKQAQAQSVAQGSPGNGAAGAAVSPANRRASASPAQLQALSASPPPPPPPAAQPSEPNLRSSPGGPVVAGGGGPGGASPGLSGKSWRDKEEALQRLQARCSQRDLPSQLSAPAQGAAGLPYSAAGGAYLPHLAGDVDSALERHREQRQLRSSRPQSPDYSGGGGGSVGMSSPPGAASAAHLDPRTRMKLRKEEEARRREAELLHARKAYFEERKQAAARLQQLYNPSAGNQAVTTARRLTESSSTSPHGDHYSSHAVSYASPFQFPQTANVSHSGGVAEGGAIMRGEISAMDVAMGLSGPQQSYYGAGGGGGGAQLQRAITGLALSDSDDDMEIGGGGEGGGALQEFEAELVGGGGGGGGGNGGGGGGGSGGVSSPAAATARVPPQLQQALDRGGLAERILVLREACALHLGQPLYELIYGYIRKRMAQGLTDDTAFKQEVQQRLGPERKQYVHLIDQLIYFEDMHELQAAMK